MDRNGALACTITNVTRLRHHVQNCNCPPQWWRHSVEVGLVTRWEASRTLRPGGPVMIQAQKGPRILTGPQLCLDRSVIWTHWQKFFSTDVQRRADWTRRLVKPNGEIVELFQPLWGMVPPNFAVAGPRTCATIR
eukprot:366545-Chlamydomonas_euryale.AAC.3